MHELIEDAKLRFVLPVAFAGFALPYVLSAFLLEADVDLYEVSVVTLAVDLAAYCLALGLLWACWLSDKRVGEVVGPLPRGHETRGLILLGIPMVGTAICLFYVLYYPLSFVAPEFVLLWAIETPELLVPAERPSALVINAGAVVLLVGAAPLVEEVLFRGFLLGRLAAKFGHTVAVVSSSALFALLHTDVLGSFVFSVFACLIYYRFKSLAAPILMHAANNLVVAVWVGIEVILLKIEYAYTLEEFYAALWLAPVGAAIGIPWLTLYLRRHLLPRAS